MAVVATLIQVDGRRVIGLDDPTGGTFDAAGDFDLLLDQAELSLDVLGRVDPFGVTTVDKEDMDGLIADIDRLMQAGNLKPVESRGLQRLRQMAKECVSNGSLQIMFVGD